MKKIFLILSIAILAIQNVKSQIVINEYSASNSNIIADFQGDFEDYIELYNTSGTAVNLTGYFLSDDATVINKWTFPNITIPANGRKLIYCSDKDTLLPSGQLHTSFKLTQCKNEKIIFANAAQLVLDSLTMLRTKNNDSRGRLTDGGAIWGVFTTPNPNAANSGNIVAYADRPAMSIAPGFYTGAQVVSLSTTQPNITIRYTINGDVPTVASTAYTVPINIGTTTVIRAACFSSDPAIDTSFVETNTYFINVNHSAPFNVISLCGKYANFFNNGNTIRNSVEFFDTLKNFKWDFEGTTQRHGQDSWAYPQKGFRIYAEDEFGYIDKMREQFFPNSPRTEFKTIILKAAASDNFAGNTGQPTAHMRDAFCHTFSIKYGWEFDERNYAPTIIYLNGQYWGVYEIRERVDADYTDYYYNQPEKKIDMVRHWGGGTNIIDAGSDTGWTNLRNFCVGNNMAIPANYNYVQSVLNINSLIDFFVLNNYIVNSDHLTYNTMWWRGRKGAGVKWKYALWDQDNIFNLGELWLPLSTTGPDLDPCEPFSLFNNDPIIFHTQIINALLTNPDFKKAYRDRYANWLSTSLTCDTLLAHLDYFKNLLAPEMPAQIAKWPGNGASMVKWLENVDSIKSFILQRCSLIGSSNDSSCIPVKKITLNVDAVGMGNIKFGTTNLTTYPYKQIVGGDTIYNIEAIANPGYRFVKWLYFNSKNIITPTVLNSIAFLDYREQDSIVALFEVKPLDTFNILITASPTWAGTILVDGTTLLSAANFPYILKAVEKTSHTILATPDADHTFNTWTQSNLAQNPVNASYKEKQIGFTANANDVFTALFDTLIKVNTNVSIPNAFTPNGDNLNDYFGVNATQNEFITDVTLRIYDRFGTVMYNGNGKNTGWDGKFNGTYVAVGTYMYDADIKFINGKTKKFKGDLMMMR
jgi:gliding motility-associated-like protein